jgi:hypothetical protein
MNVLPSAVRPSMAPVPSCCRRPWPPGSLQELFTERNTPILLVIDGLDEARNADYRLRRAGSLPWRIILTLRQSSWRQGYSIVPDLCVVSVDIRLTLVLDEMAALALLGDEVAASVDAAWPETPPTRIHVTTRWPPCAWPDGSPLRDAEEPLAPSPVPALHRPRRPGSPGVRRGRGPSAPCRVPVRARCPRGRPRGCRAGGRQRR